MNEIMETFSDPYITTITPDTGVEFPKMDAKVTYLENNNINEDICQKLRNKDVYETGMQNIYNLILGQTNEKLQE